MPKRLPLIILLAIVLASQISCVKARPPTSNTQSPAVVPPSQASAIYTNSYNGFTIEHPKTWIDITKQLNNQGIVVAFKDPESCDTLVTNFLITKETLDTALSAKAYFDLNQPTVSGMSQYAPLSTDEVTME